MDQDQTAPIGAVNLGSTLFASILNFSVMLDNYVQQTTSADDIFRCIFIGAFRVRFCRYWSVVLLVIKQKSPKFETAKYSFEFSYTIRIYNKWTYNLSMLVSVRAYY